MNKWMPSEKKKIASNKKAKALKVRKITARGNALGFKRAIKKSGAVRCKKHKKFTGRNRIRF